MSGDRINALKQGLNINPLALSGQSASRPPVVRPYAAGEEDAASSPSGRYVPPTPYESAPGDSPSPSMGPPPPRPPKPSSRAEPAPVAVLTNPYDGSTAGVSPTGRSKRQSTTVALGPIPTLPPLDQMLAEPPTRPPRLTSSSSSQLSSSSSFSSSSSSPSISDEASLPDSARPLLVNPSKDRVLGRALTPKRLPTNKNQEIRALQAEVARLKSDPEKQSLLSSSGDGGDQSQVEELKKERDNFRMLAKKLQEESQKTKVQLEELRRAGGRSSDYDARLRELEELLAEKEASISRLRAENARREGEILRLDPSDYHNPRAERERLAQQREELEQMKADEAKAEVARLREQIAQLKRIMERRVSQVEASLEEETRNSVNLLAEKRRLEDQLKALQSAATPNYFKPLPPDAPDEVDGEFYPEPDLARNKQSLYENSPSGQYSDVPLLSAVDFSNPPPMRPKTVAIRAQKPEPLCNGLACTIL